MSHERTVQQLAREIEHLTGVKIRIRWIPFYGIFLEDTETGNRYATGKAHKYEFLSPTDQERLCRALGREHWIVLLGFKDPDD